MASTSKGAAGASDLRSPPPSRRYDDDDDRDIKKAASGDDGIDNGDLDLRGVYKLETDDDEIELKAKARAVFDDGETRGELDIKGKVEAEFDDDEFELEGQLKVDFSLRGDDFTGMARLFAKFDLEIEDDEAEIESLLSLRVDLKQDRVYDAHADFFVKLKAEYDDEDGEVEAQIKASANLEIDRHDGGKDIDLSFDVEGKFEFDGRRSKVDIDIRANDELMTLLDFDASKLERMVEDTLTEELPRIELLRSGFDDIDTDELQAIVVEAVGQAVATLDSLDLKRLDDAGEAALADLDFESIFAEIETAVLDTADLLAA